MERGDPLPWLAVAIEEEAVGLEHSTRTSCMGSVQMWRKHQLLGLFTGGGSPHYFVIYLTEFTHVSIH
jgi:hypothetical protein